MIEFIKIKLLCRQIFISKIKIKTIFYVSFMQTILLN